MLPHVTAVTLLLIGSVVSAADEMCMPFQFTISEGGNTALQSGQVSSYMCEAAVDYTSMETGGRCMSYLPKVVKFRVVQKCKEGFEYYINEDAKACSKVKLSTQCQRCLPPGKKVMDMYYGDHALNATGILTQVSGVNVFYAVTQLPDTDNSYFLPMSSSIIDQGQIKLLGIGYFNYVKGIKDRSVFDVPDYCTAGNSPLQGDHYDAAMHHKIRKELSVF